MQDAASDTRHLQVPDDPPSSPTMYISHPTIASEPYRTGIWTEPDPACAPTQAAFRPPHHLLVSLGLLLAIVQSRITLTVLCICARKAVLGLGCRCNIEKNPCRARSRAPVCPACSWRTVSRLLSTRLRVSRDIVGHPACAMIPASGRGKAVEQYGISAKMCQKKPGSSGTRGTNAACAAKLENWTWSTLVHIYYIYRPWE